MGRARADRRADPMLARLIKIKGPLVAMGHIRHPELENCL